MDAATPYFYTIHVLENDHILLPYTPPTIFYEGGTKISLKCVTNFRGRKNNLMKFFHVMCHKVGMITYVQIFGGLTPKKFGRAKISKIWHNFRQLSTLTVIISADDQCAENLKQT